MIKYVAAMLCVTLIACSAIDHVTLRNTGGMTVQCGPFPINGLLRRVTVPRISECVEDYKRQGYLPISDGPRPAEAVALSPGLD